MALPASSPARGWPRRRPLLPPPPGALCHAARGHGCLPVRLAAAAAAAAALSCRGGGTRGRRRRAPPWGHRPEASRAGADAALRSANDAATDICFFGVYDGHDHGHGGPPMANAKYCTNHLHIEFPRPEFHSNLLQAVDFTFLRMAVMLRERKAGILISNYGGYEHRRKYKNGWHRPPYQGPMTDVCTACVALIIGNQIIVGNAGDSLFALSRNEQEEITDDAEFLVIACDGIQGLHDEPRSG
ncbi:hypothetical protein ACP4OV_011222 [Aristida adscensionis]